MFGIDKEKQSVLIVEDEITQRRILQEQLETLGYHVLTGTNGQEGIKIWQANSEIRIVITDLQMPGVDSKR